MQAAPSKVTCDQSNILAVYVLIKYNYMIPVVPPFCFASIDKC